MKTPEQLQAELLAAIAEEWTATDAEMAALNEHIDAAAQLCNDSTTASDITALPEPITYPATIRYNGAPATIRTDEDARKILEQILNTFSGWRKLDELLSKKNDAAHRSAALAQRTTDTTLETKLQ
jgi:hypothetical protein